MPPYSDNFWMTSSSAAAGAGNRLKSALHLSSSSNSLLELVAQELETMKRPKQQQQRQQKQQPSSAPSTVLIPTEHTFPPACLRLMSSLPGNSTCIDCHSRTDISWASVSFGCLMCLQCSGKHRSLGVQTSFVKSVSMDSWKVHEVLSMLEGGNEQLDKFFERHEMGKSAGGDANNNNNHNAATTKSNSPGTGNGRRNNGGLLLLDRYKTKAASFYRQHLINHAKELGEGGLYKGREASRSKTKKPSSSSSSSSRRKHQRNQPSKSNMLPTVTESSASMAESEPSNANDNYDDTPVQPQPPSSSSPAQPLKRHRSKGSGSDVGMEISALDLDERNE